MPQSSNPLAVFQPCISSQDQFLSLEMMCPGVYLLRPLFVRKKAFWISCQEINSTELCGRKSILMVKAEMMNWYQIDVI